MFNIFSFKFDCFSVYPIIKNIREIYFSDTLQSLYYHLLYSLINYILNLKQSEYKKWRFDKKGENMVKIE